MKALVVYESMFGNTELVARAIAEGLRESGEAVLLDVVVGPPGEVPEGVDLLVVGGPTHAMSMSRASTRVDAIRQGADRGAAGRGIREWLDALPQDLQGLVCTAFDTRVSRVRRLPGSAAKAAGRVLRRRHGRLVAEPESFFVGEVSGPLAEGQLGLARTWGARLAVLTANRTIDAR